MLQSLWTQSSFQVKADIKLQIIVTSHEVLYKVLCYIYGILNLDPGKAIDISYHNWDENAYIFIFNIKRDISWHI